MKQKTRILLINDHVFLGGGGDVVLHSEREYLESCGYEVYLYGWGSADSSNDRIVLCPENEAQRYRYYNKFVSSRRMRLFFRETLQRIKPDIIHIHLVSKYPLSIYPELQGYKVIQTLHGPNLFCATSWGCLNRNSSPCELGIGFKCYKRGCVSFKNMIAYCSLNRRLIKSLRSNISCWHCPSRNIYNAAHSLGYKNLVYIPLGIDKQYISEVNCSNNIKDKIVLFVGAVAKVKGLEYLYASFKKVLIKIPEAKLLIAGGGEYLSVLNDEIKKDKLNDSVKLLGKVPHEQIIELYRKATVFVVPSIWQEQFGLVGPEALAMGVPVVGSNIGGIPEWLHHNEWGYLVAPRDVESMTNRILGLLNSPNKSYEMGQRGRNFVINEYPYQNYVSRMQLLIDNIINEKNYQYCY